MGRQIVILSSDIAVGAEGAPFADDAHNDSYADLLEAGAGAGMDITLAHPQQCSSRTAEQVRQYRNGGWQLAGPASLDCVWDRDCRPTREKAELFAGLTASKTPVHNCWELDRSVSDKHLNFYLMPDHVPFNICVADHPKGIRASAGIFRQSSFHPDVSPEILLLKPRTSYGGEGIVVLSEDREPAAGELDERFEYVLQVFLETSEGIPELGVAGRHDLRVILADGEPVSCSIRQPEEGQILSNVARGGRLRHLPVEELPEEARRMALAVDRKLREFPARLYAVDMARGASGRWWIFEINARPGFVWNPADAGDIRAKQELHRAAVKWLARHALSE